MSMHFSSGINCPPYETADGFLQTTRGCSHSHCLFCTYFKDQKFCKSPIEEIEPDIKEITASFGAPKRIFLQGADGFAADYDVLMKTAELLHKYVPSVESIGGYARIDNFYDKTGEQLRNLASVGYSNPNIGVEVTVNSSVDTLHYVYASENGGQKDQMTWFQDFSASNGRVTVDSSTRRITIVPSICALISRFLRNVKCSLACWLI